MTIEIIIFIPKLMNPIHITWNIINVEVPSLIRRVRLWRPGRCPGVATRRGFLGERQVDPGRQSEAPF